MADILLNVFVAGVVLFAVTNIDDLFVLVGFLSAPRVRLHDVVLGQAVGIGALVAISVVAARASLLLPMPYVGLLGFVPIVLGIKALIARDDDDEEPSAHSAGSSWQRMLAVAGVTVANGGDNIGVYTPVFAIRTAAELLALMLVFMFMTALWCWGAHWLVHHRKAGAYVRKFAQRLFPYVLIAIGAWVIYEADSVSLLT